MFKVGSLLLWAVSEKGEGYPEPCGHFQHGIPRLLQLQFIQNRNFNKISSFMDFGKKGTLGVFSLRLRR